MPVTNNQVSAILKTLRDPKVGLLWISEEIVSSIELGKLSTKTFDEAGKKAKGMTTEPLSEEEEMVVTLETLRAYLLTLPEMWESANGVDLGTVRTAGGRKRVSIHLDDEMGESIEPVSGGRQELSKFKSLLEEALAETSEREGTKD